MTTTGPYRSHADLGGRPNAEPIAVHEPEDERFHAAWEARALAVTLAMGATGEWNIDMSRAARETLPGYAQLSYYQVWIAALEALLAERNLAGAAELAAAQARPPARPVARVLAAADVAAALARGSPTVRPSTSPARYAVGDAVRMRSGAAPHHTRRPAYTWGRAGRVVQVHAPHVFADANARGLGEQPQWLYAVEFDGRELWGDAADAGHRVRVDAWESYLEPAAAPAAEP